MDYEHENYLKIANANASNVNLQQQQTQQQQQHLQQHQLEQQHLHHIQKQQQQEYIQQQQQHHIFKEQQRQQQLQQHQNLLNAVNRNENQQQAYQIQQQQQYLLGDVSTTTTPTNNYRHPTTNDGLSQTTADNNHTLQQQQQQEQHQQILSQPHTKKTDDNSLKYIDQRYGVSDVSVANNGNITHLEQNATTNFHKFLNNYTNALATTNSHNVTLSQQNHHPQHQQQQQHLLHLQQQNLHLPPLQQQLISQEHPLSSQQQQQQPPPQQQQHQYINTSPTTTISTTTTSTNSIIASDEIQTNDNKQKRKFDTTTSAIASTTKDTDDTPDAKKTMEEKKIINLRKNIRDVMDETQLDTSTLAAQREESERLARVAEQQKAMREYQRQTAVHRQFVRTQNRVMSLLQSGKTYAKITDSSNIKELPPPAINVEECTDNSSSSSSTAISAATTTAVLASNSSNSSSQLPTTTSTEVETILDDEKSSNSLQSNTDADAELTNQPADVVTIEDSSSEDDCILLSDEEELIDEETEDDPHNSGMHVQDSYNVPDEQGRVVVNLGHGEGEEDIFVAPQIAKTIKPHQIGGVRFLFDNIIESTQIFKKSSGFGCILAHSMGLGKTLQVVCFCDIFLRHTDSKTVLCVMPINTLQNWLHEFNMWLPKHSDNPEEMRPRHFDVFVLNDQQKTLSARAKVILRWAEEGGVLLIGYELFRLLASKIVPARRRRGQKTGFTESLGSETNKRLIENVFQALVKPGPDLVICDEGHRIKNAHAGISVALKQIRTRRRIVLTGYPLQNNLLEYWCMVDFVRPNYLGTRTEFCNMFERPIQNGQCIDSTPEDIKLMRYRAHVLHSLLLGFVQRRSHVVLQQTLPQKLEYVILTRMTAFQRKLYETFMNDVVRTRTVPNPLKAFSVCCKIWNHPDVLYNFLKRHENDLDIEIEESEISPDNSSATTATPTANTPTATPTKISSSTECVSIVEETQTSSMSSCSVANTQDANLIRDSPQHSSKSVEAPVSTKQR